jgi:hypothetical protein
VVVVVVEYLLLPTLAQVAEVLVGLEPVLDCL